MVKPGTGKGFLLRARHRNTGTAPDHLRCLAFRVKLPENLPSSIHEGAYPGSIWYRWILYLSPTGLGPIYDGISHVLLSMDDLLPIVALVLLAGLNGPVAGRRTLFALSVSWPAGWMLKERV